MKKLYAFCLVLLTALVAQAQPIDPPGFGFNLAAGAPYQFNAWPASARLGTYPPNATFLTTINADPNVWATTYNAPNRRMAVWLCPYNLSGRSRFIGLNDKGIQFILTSAGQNLLCNTILPADTINSRPFALNVNLDTRNLSSAAITYKVQLQQAGDGATPRQASLSLGYRLSILDTFRLVPQQETFSTSGRSNNDSAIYSLNIPQSLLDQPNLQLAWIYYLPELAGASGSRPYVRLDDITITGTPLSVSKKNAFHFGLAPNPSQGAVKLTDSYAGAKQITVYNLIGSKVLNLNTSTNETELNIAQKGIYLVEVIHLATGDKATRKVVIE